MKNQFDPVMCLKQLSEQMRHLCLETEYFKRLIDRFSVYEINQLATEAIQSYI